MLMQSCLPVASSLQFYQPGSWQVAGFLGCVLVFVKGNDYALLPCWPLLKYWGNRKWIFCYHLLNCVNWTELNWDEFQKNLTWILCCWNFSWTFWASFSYLIRKIFFNIYMVVGMCFFINCSYRIAFLTVFCLCWGLCNYFAEVLWRVWSKLKCLH